MKIRNPRTGDADYEIAPLSASELEAVAGQLRDAQPVWAARPVGERAGCLRRLATAIERHADAIAKALTADTGRAKISRIEVDGTIKLIERWAVSAEAIIEAATVANRATSIPRHQHFDAVGALSAYRRHQPVEFPADACADRCNPGVDGGLRGDREAIRSHAALHWAADGRRVTEVPEIPLMLIEGDGATGAAMVPLMDYIAFTGSVATGRKVGAAAAEAFIPASLELGGKDPMLILASADPVGAAETALRASVVNNGQACQSIERIYVAREIAEPFLAALAEKAKAVRFNHPDIDSGDIGPFIFEKQASDCAGADRRRTGKGCAVAGGRQGGKSRRRVVFAAYCACRCHARDGGDGRGNLRAGHPGHRFR